MAPKPTTTDAVMNEREIMESVAAGLEACGFPALGPGDFEESVAGVAFKPECAADLQKFINTTESVDALAVESAGDSVFGEHSGSSTATARFVRREMTVPEAIREFHEQGQIEAILNDARRHFADSGMPAGAVLQFTLWTFAKGWVAERALAETERFTKMAESNDIGGQDFYDTETGEYVQVKSITRGYRADGWEATGRPALQGTRGNHRDENGVTVMYYDITKSGDLVYGRNHCDVNGASVEGTAVTKTDNWKHRMW